MSVIKMGEYDFLSNLTYLMIEPNSFCNLHCPSCNRDRLVEEGKRTKKTLDLIGFEKILEPFLDSPIDTIKIEGLSEPMFHPEFDKVCELVRKRFPNAFVIVATNLQYSIDKTPFKKTLPFVDMTYLSIDGVREVYEQKRLGGRWDTCVQNLDWIKENIPKEQRKKLNINYVVDNANVDCLEEILQLNSHYGLGELRINLMQNWNEDETNENDFNNDQFLQKLKKYKEFVKGVPGWDFKNCFWPFEGAIVDVEGDVRQCIVNTSSSPITNVHRKEFKNEFNNGEYYQNLRTKLQNNVAADSCRNCDYKFLSKPLKSIFSDESSKRKPREFFNDFST